MTSLTSIRRLATVVSLAALTALGLGTTQAVADNDKTITWRVQSHWPSASSSFTDSLANLRDTLAERTNGRLQLQIHEAGALFPADEIFPAVRRGIIEMGTISPAYIMNRVSTAGIASGLPFAFRNTWEAAYFHMNLGFEEILREEVAELGVYYHTDKVYPTEMVSRRPIESLSDFERLRIRSSGALQVFLTEAGAAASMIAGPELYPALSQGVVDAAHWGAAQGAMSMSLYEVAKYHVLPPLNIAGTDAWVINQKALDDLPDDIRAIVLQTLEQNFWERTNVYQYKETITRARAQSEYDVQINQLPPEVLEHLTQVAQERWNEEAKKSDAAARAVELLRGFLAELGYL